MRLCEVDGCDRQHRAKGMCLMHYKAVRRPAPPTPDDRFWARVTQQGDCWIWTGPHSAGGYGVVQINGVKWLAHRYAYTVLIGDIPDGLQLDHLCRNKSCVNAYGHLDPVTSRVNTLRSDGVSALRARMTHCPRGHEFTPENIYSRPDRDGSRMCRRCCEAREAARPPRRSAA